MRYRLSLITMIFTFIAFILGNLVTATGAEDACGDDWPKCNGSYIPDFTDPLIVIEYSHRVFTGALGFLILFNSIMAWKKRQAGERAISILAPLSAFLLFAQALAGGINVLLATPPGFTTIDVAISQLLMISLVLLTVALKREPVQIMPKELAEQEKKKQKIYRTALLTLILFYVEVLFGAFFKHSGASGVFVGIDLSEQLVYSVTVAQFIYFIHGTLTFFILVSTLSLFFYAVRLKLFVYPSFLLVALVSVEGLIGFATVLSKLAVVSSSVHMITATLSLCVAAFITGKSGFGSIVVVKENESDGEIGAEGYKVNLGKV